nr:retrovirus-related Pol polyprotein from transposon 17.6 [Tanacetum cinerariifolium]
MPFGLCNAPATFQRCLLAIFHDMIEESVEVFMDDFFVFRNSFEACLINLNKMLQRCKDAHLVLNWKKCHFMVKEGIVLGHKMFSAGLKVDKAKIDVISKLPPPTNIKGIRSFLGHAGFYRRFIKDFSKIARPLTKLLEKDTPFKFDDECQKAFELLKEKLTCAPVIVSPNWNLPFELMCDASDFVVGAVLGQKDGPFPKSYKFEYILVIVDYVSKWAEAQALPTNDARVVVTFLKKLFYSFGMPKALISDRCTHFCNKIMEKIMKRYGVNHHFYTSYHPQASGQVENTNRALKIILKKTVKDNLAIWSRKLDDALWAFRTAYKTPTGTTPYKLIYGINCHLPFEIEHRTYWALKNCNPDLIAAGSLEDTIDPNSRIYTLWESIFSSCYLFCYSFSSTTMGDKNPIFTLGDYSKLSHEGYRNTIKLPEGNNVVPLRSDTMRNFCATFFSNELTNIRILWWFLDWKRLDVFGARELRIRVVPTTLSIAWKIPNKPSLNMHPRVPIKQESINAITIHRKLQIDSYNDITKENEEEERESPKSHSNSSTPPEPSISFLIEKVLKFNSLIESLGLVPPSPNAELICTKEKDGDVMFIEIIPKDDDSRKEEPEAEGQEMEYSDIFPTRSKLAYHKYLMCGPIPSIFLRNPIITGGCHSNLKIPCNIRHVHVENTYIDLNSLFNVMTRMMYNWIMKKKLDPREDANRGISNSMGRIKGMHVFIGNFTYVIDFMIVEDISSILDPRLSQVVLGRPFIEISDMTHNPPKGVVRFIRGTNEVAYKMPHKIEQYDSLSDLEKEHTKSVYLRNEKDKRRGVEYVMRKILGFYKECLELGPEYLTGIDNEG